MIEVFVQDSTVKRFKKEFYYNFVFLSSSKSEQQKIADFFSKLDETLNV